ncbi:MAG: site-specific integrase [Planctomycetes bacterium]|nr:site-specific integrase [Planctomycetota bacterium]
MRGYGQWLGYLARKGKLDESPLPLDRLTPESVQGYVDSLRSRVKVTTAYLSILGLRRAVCSLAPETDWDWLREIERKVYRLARGQRSDHAVVPIEWLYLLGEHLMSRADHEVKSLPRKRGVLYRDGLLIALLAARPIRRKNISALRIRRHLIKTANGWTLFVPATETKHRRSIEFPLPTELTRPIDRFLSIYRPNFPGADEHDFLWPACTGGPLLEPSVSQALARRTRAAFGFCVGPNSFRVSAATSIAIHDPVNVATATRLLGHTWIKTTGLYYNRATTKDASRRYQRHLEALRKRLDLQAR